MKNKKKIFGIIIAIEDYRGIYNQNKELFEQFSKDFKEVYVINLINLKFRKKNCKIKNKNLFPNNYKFFDFSSSSDFLKFFKEREMIAVQYLGKNPDFFKILFLIKMVNIKNIMISNLSSFGMKLTPDFNINNIFAWKQYYQKGFYYLFRILTILNLFPKIDLLFESNSDLIKAHNNGLSRKFEKLFPFFKISYFRKIEKINSIFFDQLINFKTSKKSKKKYILFIDVPIDHGDRVIREGNVSSETKKNYYQKLKLFLNKIEDTLKYKVIIGAHPSSKIVFKYLSNFEISKKRTIDLIPNCEVAVVTHSSLISSAVIYNKNILSIKSKNLGKCLSNVTKKYKDSLGLISIDIDKKIEINKKNILKKMNLSKKKYKKWLKSRIISDGKNEPNKKITEIIKKKFELNSVSI